MFHTAWFADMVARHGYWLVFGVVMLESAGIPMPGETALVLAAIYAGATGQLDIFAVVGVAALAAIIGDNIGYWAGRRFGLPFLSSYGRYVHLTPERLLLGQYLFARHGAKIVFFGRFAAFLRTFAALLAGVNLYPQRQFMFWNATGGIVWASVFGFGGYFFGNAIREWEGPIGKIGLIAAVIGFALFFILFKRHEARLMEEASLHAAKAQDNTQSRDKAQSSETST